MSEDRRRMLKLKQRTNSSFCLFVLFKPSVDWIMPPYIGEGIFFTQSTGFQHKSLPETPSQTPPEMMFDQLSGHLLVQSTWCKKFTITSTKYIQDSCFLLPGHPTLTTCSFLGNPLSTNCITIIHPVVSHNLSFPPWVLILSFLYKYKIK